MSNHNIYNSIIIIIIHNSIYNSSEIKMSSLLKTDNKNINKIQEILTSAKVKDLSN